MIKTAHADSQPFLHSRVDTLGGSHTTAKMTATATVTSRFVGQTTHFET